MTIGEVERRCGMERANIRFYEREGLLAPERRENGYREYTEENVQALLRIRLLRSLRVPLEEIGALIRGERELDDTLREQLERLEHEQQSAAAAGAVCRELRSEHATYQTLDAQRYLGRLEEAMHTPVPACPPWDREDAAPRCPVRRYLARQLDMLICTVLACAVLAACGVTLGSAAQGFAWLALLVQTALALCLEPLFLHWFGATPGKAILGLHIETEDGTHLTVSEAWTRMWEMVWYGQGAGLAFFGLYRLYQSFVRSDNGEAQPWDDGYIVTLRDRKWQRTAGYLAAVALCFFTIVVLTLAQRLPPNRGPLTMAQYAENFAYYEKLLDVEFEKELGADGAWHEPQREDGMIVISMHPDAMPEYHFEMENGGLRRVWFTYEPSDMERLLGSYHSQMLICALSLAGAQRQNGLFSGFAAAMEEAVPTALASFTFEEYGVRAACELTSNGYYMIDDVCVPMGEVPPEEREFHLRFSVEITE